VTGHADHWRAASLLGLALSYATLRYNVFKGVPWADWPAYTVNKALAVGALLIIAAAVIRLARSGRRSGVLLGWAGALALAHSLLSFAMLNPVYYPRLFDDGRLTAIGGLAMALGALLMAAMDVGARRSVVWSHAARHRTLALIALGSGVHAALPGLPSWTAPGSWPGGLPPLTLISFLASVLAVAVWLPRARAH